MNAKPRSVTLGALALFASLTPVFALAQNALTTPAGYQPGWQVAVYKAGAGLGQASGGRLTGFLAPAGGFDMASYRDSLQSALNYGLFYDAQGLLNIAVGGPHRVGVRLDWNPPEPGSPEAHCATTLFIDGGSVESWTGSVSTPDGHNLSGGSVDLHPGPHQAQLHVACDQPLGVGLRVTVLLKTPGDADLRPMSPVEVVHPASGGPTAPPPETAPAPPVSAAPPPVPSGAPPEAYGQGLVAVVDLSVRERPDRRSRRVGKLAAGQQVDVAGPADDPAWVRLAGGGYVESGYLKPQGAAGPARPGVRHRVGDCRPYQMQADVGGGRSGSVTGKACLQADGTWRVVH